MSLSMDSLTWTGFVAILVAAFGSTSNIVCGFDECRPARHTGKTRLNDVSQAIEFMHQYMPTQMSLDEKCKRYAVMSSKAISEKLPHKRTVHKVATVDFEELDKQYSQIDITRISYVYMTAIDRYRVTKLAPPFIDLVECLKKIDTPIVKKYLSNIELIIILDLYKQVLGMPNTNLDVKSLDLSGHKFSPAFLTWLGMLFKGKLDIPGISEAQLPGTSGMVEADVAKLDKKQLKQLQQEEHICRRRERSRLRQQRLRAIDPDLIRARRREQQRKRTRVQREVVSARSPARTPEEAKFRRKVLDRREKRNAIQRQRRQRAKERQLRQFLELSFVKRSQHNLPEHKQPPDGMHSPHQEQPDLQAPRPSISIPEQDIYDSEYSPSVFKIRAFPEDFEFDGTFPTLSQIPSDEQVHDCHQVRDSMIGSSISRPPDTNVHERHQIDDGIVDSRGAEQDDFDDMIDISLFFNPQPQEEEPAHRHVSDGADQQLNDSYRTKH